MTDTRPLPDRDNHEEISPDEIRQELASILADPAFSASARRREMLKFLVDEMLAGRGNLLKGTTIAIDVFKRDTDFDSNTDPVVRIEARRLRSDLDSYYIDKGRDDPIRITIPKGGYLPHFERFHAVQQGPDPAEIPDSADIAHVTRPRWWVPLAVTAALTVAAIIVSAGLWFGPVFFGAESSSPNAAGAVALPSVIVKPLSTVTSATEDRNLADGITIELTTYLMHFPGFRMYSADESFELAEATADSTDIPSAAAFLVEGSVRVETDRVFIGVQLLDRERQVLWSGSFNRDFTTRNLLEIQTEIATEIASKLGQPYGVIRNELVRETANLPDPEVTSYICVLRAYTYRRTNRVDLYRKTRDCLEDAVRRDPDYAEAWAMLTYLRMDAGRYGYDAGVSSEDAYALAEEAGLRALALDPENVQALKALSFIAHYTGNYAEAQELARRALKANPNDPDTLAQLGWRLAVRGDFAEGIPYIRQAIARSVNPAPWYFHMIAIDHLMRKEYPEMLAAARRAAADGSSISQSLLAIAYGGLGNRAAAAKALASMAEKWPLLNEDPAAAYAVHHVTNEISDTIVAGLRNAGWTPPQDRD